MTRCWPCAADRLRKNSMGRRQGSVCVGHHSAIGCALPLLHGSCFRLHFWPYLLSHLRSTLTTFGAGTSTEARFSLRRKGSRWEIRSAPSCRARQGGSSRDLRTATLPQRGALTCCHRRAASSCSCGARSYTMLVPLVLCSTSGRWCCAYHSACPESSRQAPCDPGALLPCAPSMPSRPLFTANLHPSIFWSLCSPAATQQTGRMVCKCRRFCPNLLPLLLPRSGQVKYELQATGHTKGALHRALRSQAHFLRVLAAPPTHAPVPVERSAVRRRRRQVPLTG